MLSGNWMNYNKVQQILEEAGWGGWLSFIQQNAVHVQSKSLSQ